ncbi:hypothetical protein MLD38_000320 [Melastoma candidum]|uniref:Uncharacterized protein n=1 Tax=Melastoma candidum TaxID=119954 RepID=A0ACB9SIA8_9MYRT|nr:hypothetical protein MLD38_000320 [Melastoma candidum]
MAVSGNQLGVFLAFALLLLSSSQGSLLPLLDPHPGNWIGDLLTDPFRALEHDPFGIERDQQRSLSALPARVDWKETKDGHQIMIELPGLKKEDVKIEVDEKNRVLRVSGERKVEEVKEEDHWHRIERFSGKFWRQFRLPDDVDLENVDAKLEHGVLTLKMSKLTPEKIKGPRVVSIAGGEEEPQKLKSEL